MHSPAVQVRSEQSELSARAASVRHPELDGLRGIAILLVIIFHYSRFIRSGPIADHLIALTNLAWSGVDLFFVLSGFLIGGILIDYRDSPNMFSVFYTRRTLRIFPLYFLVIFSYAICLSLHLKVPYLFDRQIPFWPYALFLQNFAMACYGSGSAYLGPTWSLAVEEQFYLLFPLIVWLMPPRTLPYLLLTAIAFAIPLRVALYHFYSAHHFLSFYVLMPCRADALSIGVLCAVVYRSASLRMIFTGNIYWLRWLAAAVLLSFTFMINPIFDSRLMLSGGYTILSAVYGSILLIALLGSDGHIRYITTRKWLCGLGRIAFAVYLFHLAIVGFVYAALTGNEPTLNSPKDLVVSTASIAVTVLLAVVSWQYFERHFIALGSRFRYRDA
jgi:peptidoglycan/LPS O-acetylase OafA/YrhL